MKKIKISSWPFLIVFLFFLAFGCSGGGSGGSVSSLPSSSPSSSSPLTEEVTLTGNFSGGIHSKKNWLKRAFASLSKKAHALNPNQVAKVLIFSAGTYTYKTAYVIDGKFTVSVPRSNPIGMIFVGYNNEYLGYLYLKNNIASLPMSRVKSSVATIDLGTLSSSGSVVEPTNNPLGNEIPLTDEEIRALAQFNGLFASLVKNPDIDGNGIIDCLESKKYFMELIYGVAGGSFDNNLTPSIDMILEQYQIYFFSNTSDCPISATLTGPDGSPYSSPTSMEKVQVGSYCTYKIRYLPLPGNFEPPVSGNYIIDYPNVRLTFNIPDQSLILQNIIAIVPTITLNEDNVIQKITWDYRLANGSGQSFDPESLITQIQITIADRQFSEQTLYSSPLIFSASTTEIDLSSKGIKWKDVGAVNTSYYDVYGNGYGIKWYRCSVFDDNCP